MAMYYKLNDDKTVEPCDMETWAKQREEMFCADNKHIRMDIINNKRISTVWLGLNHAWDNGEPPHIFETMVFEGDDCYDIYLRRYSTWAEAEEGHKKAVQWVINGCKNNED